MVRLGYTYVRKRKRKKNICRRSNETRRKYKRTKNRI